MNIGKEADKLYALKQKKKIAAAKVDDLSKDITEQEQVVRDALKEAGTDKGGGKNANVSLTKQTVPNVVDKKKVSNFIIRNRALDLLQFRISTTAYRERLDAGKKVPGLEPVEITKLNVTKRK